MSAPPSVPNIGSLSISAPSLRPISFFHLPGELRNEIYSAFQALEEQQHHRFRIDCSNNLMHKLPKDTLNLILADERVARELLGCCYGSYEWRAVIVIDDIWSGTWRLPSTETWLKLSADGTSLLDNSVRNVRFSILYDFPKEKIELARQKYGNVAAAWRIHASVRIQLPYAVHVECNITDDALGYGVRSASLRAAMEHVISVEVERMVNSKQPSEPDKNKINLTIAEWTQLATFSKATLMNWFCTVGGGWEPFERPLK